MSEQQAQLYEDAGRQFAGSIARLARTMERDPDKARDLEQDIHLELWRSLARFEGQCSLKTWVFRVAHNVAADHIGRAARRADTADTETVEAMPAPGSGEAERAEEHALERLREIIRTLPLLDAQVILLWLEGHSGQEIADVTGLTSGAVATRITRLKTKLADQFQPNPNGDTP